MMCVLPFSIKAQQFHVVGGILSGENTWGTDSIPYYVESNLYINAFGSLTILPGTKIYIDNSIGIHIKNGNLNIEGTEEQPVEFRAFSALKWKNMSISNDSKVNIENAIFKNSENGIEITNSDNIRIHNCRFEDIYYNSISITNSNNCEISNCTFDKNYNGISIYANGADKSCSNNIIKDNIFVNGNKNIYIDNSNNSSCSDNIVKNNIFEGAPVSIHVENSNLVNKGKNYIIQNVFYTMSSVINNPLENIAIYISMDSIFIENNIFWKSGIPIYLKRENNCYVRKNTFYDNSSCFDNIPRHKELIINDNVFLENKDAICYFTHNIANKHFSNNNFLVKNSTNSLIINYTSQDIDISGNYWDITNDSIINNLIIDHNDNPIYGSVIYKPLLDNFSLSAPISPPTKVTKQLTNEGVLIKWNANQESDLKNYRIYYGDFNNYSFSNMIDNIYDTCVILCDIDIDENIAITSIDNEHNDTNNQFLGHESAFSFAQLIPYAGADDSLCESDGYYLINNANVPPSSNNLQWTSSGSGYFDNANTLSTIYFPSEMDFVNGSVVLTLNVTNTVGTGNHDSFVLRLIPNPSVYAGKDRTYFYNSTIYINDAYIRDYDSLIWETHGDGFFDNNTIINPKYHYGYQDSITGNVVLRLNAYSQCGIVSDEVSCKLIPSYGIEGRVKHNNKAVANSVVIAASIENKIISDLYKTKTDSEGYFKFDKMQEAHYILYAVPDTINETGVPTYYANNSTWHDAYKVYLNADVYDIDINLKSKIDNFIEGRGSISGKFEYPNFNFNDSSFYCSSWYEQDSSKSYCNEGLSNVVISLYDKNKTKVISYDITDKEGNFHFSNLPYGSYYIISEIPRYKTSNQYLINITERNYKIEKLIFYINESNNINLRMYNPDVDDDSKITLYPNPCDKHINIVGYFDEGSYDVEIINTNGIRVYSDNYHLSNDTHLTIPTDNLTDGVYIIKVYNSNNILYINKLYIIH